jgi:adenine deaminase
LKSVEVKLVIVDGKPIAKDRRLQIKLPIFRYPKWSKDTIHLQRKVKPSDFKIKIKKDIDKVKVRVINVGLPKRELIKTLSVKEGVVLPDQTQDVLKIVVVDRHKRTGNIGKGFLSGTGIKNGAVASSVCHDTHNIYSTGSNNSDIALSINRLAEIKGGQVAVQDGKIIGELDLPIGGIISDKPSKIVAEKLDSLENTVKKKLKCYLKPSPFFWLAIVPLPNIPDLGLTDIGLFDARTFKFTNTIIKPP